MGYSHCFLSLDIPYSYSMSLLAELCEVMLQFPQGLIKIFGLFHVRFSLLSFRFKWTQKQLLFLMTLIWRHQCLYNFLRIWPEVSSNLTQLCWRLLNPGQVSRPCRAVCTQVGIAKRKLPVLLLNEAKLFVSTILTRACVVPYRTVGSALQLCCCNSNNCWSLLPAPSRELLNTTKI